MLSSSITPSGSFLGSCDKLKKYGYKTTYTHANDKTRKDREKKSAQRAKPSALNAGDAKKDEELEKVNDKKSQDGQIKAKAERVCFAAEAAGTIVGKGNKTATTDKEKDAAIKTNLDAQKAAGSNKLVTVLVLFVLPFHRKLQRFQMTLSQTAVLLLI